jgi:hypothetical protein
MWCTIRELELLLLTSPWGTQSPQCPSPGADWNMWMDMEPGVWSESVTVCLRIVTVTLIYLWNMRPTPVIDGFHSQPVLVCED